MKPTKSGKKYSQSHTEFNPNLFLLPGLSENDVIQLKEVFDAWDTDKTGLIKPMELRAVLVKSGFKAQSSTVYDIIAEFDENESGGLDFQEFLRLMTRKPMDKETKDDVFKIFKKFDKGKTGFITLQDLRAVANELKEEIDDDQLREMISKADLSNKGKISFDDFYQAMIKPTFYQ